ncbi:MAG: shikimate kinase [Saprospiraceae bacterium]
MQTQDHVFLLGFMGCGKTHWGQLLAEKIHLPFLDLDDLISQKTGGSISQIFAEKGESDFRLLEREALRSLEGYSSSVIATGGGTPCFFDNIIWMNSVGTTIYLKTPPTLLAKRLRHEKEFRPLLSEVKDADLQAFIEKKMEEREPYYVRAKLLLEQNEIDDAFLEKMLEQITNRQ